jgi:ATP-dependent phosphoenolpyruvate carboxykinase
MYSRNIIECIKALYSDADFAKHLLLKPERHYKQNNRNQRVYHDMHTGEWWWQVQVNNDSVLSGLVY